MFSLSKHTFSCIIMLAGWAVTSVWELFCCNKLCSFSSPSPRIKWARLWKTNLVKIVRSELCASAPLKSKTQIIWHYSTQNHAWKQCGKIVPWTVEVWAFEKRVRLWSRPADSGGRAGFRQISTPISYSFSSTRIVNVISGHTALASPPYINPPQQVSKRKWM